MDVHNVSEAEIALLFKSAVPIDDSDELRTGPNDAFSIIWIDIQDRPDLQVLATKEAQPAGYTLCTWIYAGSGHRNMRIGLRIEMRQPSRFVMILDFKVSHYLEQLKTIARYGKLWIIPGPIPAYLVDTQPMTANEFIRNVVTVAGHGLFVELQEYLVEELRQQLLEWERGK
jgi:hypothetical protein